MRSVELQGLMDRTLVAWELVVYRRMVPKASIQPISVLRTARQCQ
jgi:hypothetical protein